MSSNFSPEQTPTSQKDLRRGQNLSEGERSSPTRVPTVNVATFSDLRRLTSHRECRYKFAPVLQYKAATVGADRLNCRPYGYPL